MERHRRPRCEAPSEVTRAELVSEMLTATFDVICDVALSGRDIFDASTFGDAITRYFHTAGRTSLLDFLGVPEWVPRPGELIAGAAVRTMHGMVAQAMRRAARDRARPPTILLVTCWRRRPGTGRRMTRKTWSQHAVLIVAGMRPRRGHRLGALSVGNSPGHQARAHASPGATPGPGGRKPAILPPCPSSIRCWKNPCGLSL